MWHHATVIPATLFGTTQVNSTHLFMPTVHGEAPELIDRWAKALEKVWANRAQLA